MNIDKIYNINKLIDKYTNQKTHSKSLEVKKVLGCVISDLKDIKLNMERVEEIRKEIYKVGTN